MSVSGQSLQATELKRQIRYCGSIFCSQLRSTESAKEIGLELDCHNLPGFDLIEHSHVPPKQARARALNRVEQLETGEGMKESQMTLVSQK